MSNIQPSDCCRINAKARPLSTMPSLRPFHFSHISCHPPPPKPPCHTSSCLLRSPLVPQFFSISFIRIPMWWSMFLGLIHSSCGELWIDVYRLFFKTKNNKSYMRRMGKSCVKPLWWPAGLLEDWQRLAWDAWEGELWATWSVRVCLTALRVQLFLYPLFFFFCMS